jgi:hypothetical protein
MDASEDVVDFRVAVSSSPPAFNDACVVPMHNEEVAKLRESGECTNKEFKTDCFCPPDVACSVACLPSRYESPGSPEFSDDDADADA